MNKYPVVELDDPETNNDNKILYVVPVVDYHYGLFYLDYAIRQKDGIVIRSEKFTDAEDASARLLAIQEAIEANRG